MVARTAPALRRAACGIVACFLNMTCVLQADAAQAEGDASAAGTPQAGTHGQAFPSLAARGVFLNFIYTNDVLANIAGGNRRGVIDQGKLEAIFYADLGKLAGLDGLNLFVNGFQIHNTGRIRRDYVGGINTIAAIEAVPTTRLSELWLEQKLWSGKASFRVGQLAADSEFFFSDLSMMFLQSDWATITAANLPSGGPAYPLSTPGVRLKLDPVPDASLLVAVFNGDPAGPGQGDEQRRNKHGLNFRTGDAPLVIAEAQLRAHHAKDDPALARTLKLGGWVHSGSFKDQRFADDGTLLADPAGSGLPKKRSGNSGIYAVVDQQILRPTGQDAQGGISVFSRISASPSDRNPISFFIDGGVRIAGLIRGRPHDAFGASVIYSKFSSAARALDRDQIAFSAVPGVVRDFESNLELTYMAQVSPAWTVQPVVTYVLHPGGDARRNATVAGVRFTGRF